MKTLLSLLAFVSIVTPTVSSASETQKFTYDAKGRLVKVERTGSVNNGVKTEYEHDKANNRTKVKVTGSN